MEFFWVGIAALVYFLLLASISIGYNVYNVGEEASRCVLGAIKNVFFMAAVLYVSFKILKGKSKIPLRYFLCSILALLCYFLYSLSDANNFSKEDEDKEIKRNINKNIEIAKG